MTKKHALILLGGMWHDFDGFARSMCPLLEAVGWQVESSYNLELLTRLDSLSCDLILNYTCFAKHVEGPENNSPEGMSDVQINGLTRWVRGGGAFLSAHASSVLGISGTGLADLTGGFFVEHPPVSTFTVYPVYGPHPITDGIESFSVCDEMYIERCKSVDIHLMAVERGVAYPLVWSKPEGCGRVAHVALGHSDIVWELPPYRRLMLQTVGWLTEAQA